MLQSHRIMVWTRASCPHHFKFWIYEGIQLQVIFTKQLLLSTDSHVYTALNNKAHAKCIRAVRQEITYFQSSIKRSHFQFFIFIPVTNVSPYKALNSLNLLPSTILAMT